MPDWLAQYDWLLGWALAISLVTLVASLIVVPLLVIRMRADYFVAPRPGEESWTGRHPGLRIGTRVAKNLLGVLLLVASMPMMVGPGQGLLTLFVAITLIDFPRKRRFELWVLRKTRIWRAFNWMRSRAGTPPLKLPESVDGGASAKDSSIDDRDAA